MQVDVIQVTPYAQNCSIITCVKTQRAAVIDPGGDLNRIRSALKQLGVTPEKIALTHGHVDHAGGAAELAEILSVPIEGPHQADKFLLDGLGKDSQMAGPTRPRPVTPGRWLVEGDTVAIGNLTFDVLHCPGHTPGHLVFVCKPESFAVVGDTLFAGSIGRTDMPYGSQSELIAGIKTKLLPLGDDVTILPGHGPASTIGDERMSNPFLQG